MAAIVILVLAVIISIATWAIVNKTTDDTKAKINSFKACADAGYPIQESYPERCSVPGGKTFTNL